MVTTSKQAKTFLLFYQREGELRAMHVATGLARPL